MSLFSSAAALALQRSNPKPESRFTGAVDYRYNTLVCGGYPGSAAGEKAQRIILGKFSVNYRRGCPTIFLTSDIETARMLYDSYGNSITVFGVNKAFDPFESVINADEANYILGEIINAYHNNRDLSQWSSILLSIMDMYGFEFTYRNLRIIIEHLLSEGSVSQFGKWLSDVSGSYFTDSLEALLNREWSRLNLLQMFFNEMDRQFAYVRHGGTQHESSFLVIYQPSADSALVSASLYAELNLMYRRRRIPPFSLLSMNVPLDKFPQELFLYTGNEMSFGIYASTLRILGNTLNAIIPAAENFVCLGVDAVDAETITRYYSSERKQWAVNIAPGGIGAGKVVLPELVSRRFMRGNGGIPDGGAMIYTQKYGSFKNVRILNIR